MSVPWPFTTFSFEADRDYILARWIAFAGGGFQSRAGFHAHQACEKYLKALTVQAAGNYLHTHRLSELASFAAHHHPAMDAPAAKADLARFDSFEEVGRYGAASRYDPLSKAASTSGVTVAGLWQWDSSYVHALDQVVFNMRRYLNHAAANVPDSFALVLAKSGTTRFEGDWKGSPSIYDVLTRGNASFKPPV